MKVKLLKYNWFQTGSLTDRDGAGEDWTKLEVGKDGVISIEENIPHNGMEIWNFVVSLENGTVYRIFNPNFVEYFPEHLS